MNIKTALNAIYEELAHIKKMGEETVFVSDKTLKSFQQYFQHKESSPPKKASQTESSSTSVTEEKKIIATPAIVTQQDIPTPEPFTIPDLSKEEQWKWLQNKVLSCPVCKKNTPSDKKIVFGVGNINANIFFCGEAPGEDEEKVGQPFVGAAGQLLTKIIQAMGLKREEVYIGNIMNWRPNTDTGFGNRPPNEQEIRFCLPYLKAQIQIVQPKLIVALGATAANGLLGFDKNRKLKDVRGKWLSYEDTPILITYHPSYVLRNGTKRTKRQIWEDMLKVMEKTELPISEKQKGYFSE